MDFFYQFDNTTWSRFDKITFRIPLPEDKKAYDISLTAETTREYPFENLDLNMILTTPSGEERIKEYNIKNISPGKGNQIILKEGLYISKKGNLVIEFENLMPVLKIHGISGLRIRMINAGK